MSENAGEPSKKAICRGLTAVLRESALSTAVDPKSFFMMVSTNYSALVSDRHIDLNPLFDALRASASEEDLLPVFAKFEQRVGELGMTPRLPPPLAAKDDEERAALVESYDAQRGLLAPPEEEGSEEGEVDEAAEAKRRVINTFVTGFRASPLGQRMDASQLTYFLDGRIDEVLSESRLDVRPVVDALRQQNVLDAEIYVGLALAGERLRKIGIETIEPTLDVTAELKSDLLRRAKAEDAPTRARPSAGRKHKQDADRRKNLEEFEIPTRKAPTGRGRIIRLATMAALLIGLGAYGVMTRSNRPLNAAAFADTVPLESAAMVDGAFAGTIDWDAWSKLTGQEQRRRLVAFERLLRKRGLFIDFQLRGRDDLPMVLPIENEVRARPDLFSDYAPPAPPTPPPPASDDSSADSASTAD